MFQTFAEKVSDARRGGDIDPSKAIIADTMKLIGKHFSVSQNLIMFCHVLSCM